jgi:RecA-family ATPase
MAEPETAIPWLVEPLIVRGDKALMYGEWGSLKSWLFMDLAICLATGRPWLGAFAGPGRPLRVLYVDEEMSRRRFRKRLRQLATGHELEHAGSAVALRLWSRPGLRFQTPTQTALAFAQVIREFDPDVIIVESLRRVLVGDEKEAKDMAEFWRCVDALVDSDGRERTVLVSHHMRKPRSRHEDPRHRQSGTTDIQAGTDASFAVERVAEGVVVVEQVKNRESEEYAAFTVSMRDMDLGAVQLVYAREAEAPASLFEQLKAAVPAVLQGAPDGRATSAELEARLCGAGYKFSRKTLTRALDALVKEGIIKAGLRRGTYALAG